MQYQLKDLNNQYSSIYNYVTVQINLLKQSLEINKVPYLSAVLETPKGCRYKLNYEKGIYRVLRRLENDREIPVAYGYLENIIAPETTRELACLIYMPYSDSVINSPDMGFNVVPLLAYEGLTYCQGQMKSNLMDYKVLVIPDIYLETILNDNYNTLVEEILHIAISLSTNFLARQGTNNSVFKPVRLMDFDHINHLLKLWRV